MQQISDTDELNKIVDNIIKNNYKSVEEYQNGKDKLLGFFVGQVMKETKGKGNPKLINQILKEKLKK
jgi:aspartyl-tRNA(Asn)/glutamyl-tRNA(Gln) amidotransferase subunit B